MFPGELNTNSRTNPPVPVFPLRTTGLGSQYSPYSTSRFQEIQQKCNLKCTWKCSFLLLVFATFVITTFLIYLIGKYIRNQKLITSLQFNYNKYM